ncbi:phage tail protein [Tistrella mobilis]|uniref:Tail collar domain-containing protein n=1 Tax=Tistrella mobilis (strain KA081020-065) TaxID=1110502 RepID=I3TH12_TISMK|nr:tail fiber protein [Tistrella mobilis]AFK52050.1 tail collar domain-containing protein [Tistrella mobilis KA081020-065]
MADPFYGEIRAFTFAFAPANWAYCAGQEVQIQQYQALAAVIGTMYGGNLSQNKINLPNLQGQVAVGSGTGVGLTPRTVAQQIGTETVTLSISQIPPHTHTAQALNETATSDQTLTPSATAMLGRTANAAPYAQYPNPLPSPSPVVMMDVRSLTQVGSYQAHENRQPALTLNFCICVYDGFFPVRPS